MTAIESEESRQLFVANGFGWKHATPAGAK